MVLELLNYISTNKYAHSILVLVIFYALSQLVVIVSQKILLRLTKKTKTKIDDLIVTKSNKPISLILILIGIRLAVIPQSLPAYIANWIDNIISSLITIISTYAVIIVLDIIIDSWGQKFASKTESKFDDELVNLIKRFSRIIICFIGLIFLLHVWGVEVGPLLASLGIVGIAVAFALQNTLGNIFGGISLIADRSVTVDDFIKLEDGTQGFVVDIGLRSTKIKNRDGDLIILPNGKLADAKIYNYHKPMPVTRMTVDFGVEYGTEVAMVKKIVFNELISLKDTLKKPEPEIIFDSMGDFAMKFRAHFWINSVVREIESKDAAVTAIYNALNKNKIKIPFPTRNVYLKKWK